MDIKKQPEFVVPAPTEQSKDEKTDQEQIAPSEGVNLLEGARLDLEHQQDEISTASVEAVRPTPSMTTKEMSDLGIDQIQAANETPDRQKVLLNALLEVPVKADALDAATKANELQDLASGLQEEK